MNMNLLNASTRIFVIVSELSKLGNKYRQIRDHKTEENYRLFAIEVRKSFQKLGPAFIKFGQMLSGREDKFPKVFCEELRKLLDKDPEIPYEKVRDILGKELGSNFTEKIESFDKIPIASASISQVHKAKLKDGTIVAIKIKKPGVDDIIRQDIVAMRVIAFILNLEPKLKRLELEKLIDEFKSWTKRELNLLNEAQNMKVYKEKMEEFDFLKIPTVYEELTTENVLTTGFVDGISLHSVIDAVEDNDREFLRKLKGNKINLNLVVKRIAKTVLVQTLENGFFHADLHPANIIVLRNSKIAFVDFGITGTLNDHQRIQIFLLVSGMIENDVDMIMSVIQDFCKLESVDTKLRENIGNLAREWNRKTMKDMNFGQFMYRLANILIGEKVTVPTELFLVAKELATIDGIALALSPNLSVSKECESYIPEFIAEEIAGKVNERNILKLLDSVIVFSEDVPKNVKSLFQMFKEGKMLLFREEQPEIRYKQSPLKLPIFILSVAFFILAASIFWLTNALTYKARIIEITSPANGGIALGATMLIFLVAYIILRSKLKSYVNRD